MSYCLVIANAVQSEGGLPASARRLDTQEWVMGLATASTALQQACGYYAVATTARPADTQTQTSDRSVVLVNGTPTEQWTVRPKTQAELDGATASTNNADLRAKALQAIADNLTALGTVTTGHNAITSTLANIATAKASTPGTLTAMNTKVNAVCDEVTRIANVLDGVLTQTDRLLRQVTALERLQLGQLDATTGT